MQSNDARMLVHCAVPTALAGVVAAVVSGVVAGGKGAIGAGAGAVLVILFLGSGLYALQRIARSYPHLFQVMGLLLYTTQILLLAVFLAVFKNTTLFDPQVFALALLGTTLVWIACQLRAHLKSKILYVTPEASGDAKAATTGANS